MPDATGVDVEALARNWLRDASGPYDLGAQHVIRALLDEVSALRVKQVDAARAIYAAQLHAFDLLKESGATRLEHEERTVLQVRLVELYSFVHDAVKKLAGRTDIEYPELQKVTELASELRVLAIQHRERAEAAEAQVAALTEKLTHETAVRKSMTGVADRALDGKREAEARAAVLQAAVDRAKALPGVDFVNAPSYYRFAESLAWAAGYATAYEAAGAALAVPVAVPSQDDLD